jgi:hypothetical protein
MLTKHEEPEGLAPDDPARLALELRVYRLERLAELGDWCGPNKFLAGLGEHKAGHLDEQARLTHAERFAGSPGERAALKTETDRQLVQEKHVRAMERKDVANA